VIEGEIFNFDKEIESIVE